MKMKAVYIVIAISLLYNTVSQGQKSIEEHQLPEAVKRYFPVVYPLDLSIVVTWTIGNYLQNQEYYQYCKYANKTTFFKAELIKAIVLH